MPLISRWMLRLAFAWLVVGVGFESVWRLTSTSSFLARNAVLHAVFIGWLVQLVFGTAHWLFPKVTRERPRGAEWVMATAAVTLNVGLGLRFASDVGGLPGVGWVVVSAVSSWVGVVAGSLALLPRIRGR